ncbi:hypothetical protein EYF80_034393 [Liparis tanakae]|uniref:Uncharacterized protein n=1 Tax=Liparis tanakae TaxID=230148 RepID=A0A4Z2GQ18_9TELE|nr:hypothetical protein EYF80_034393 [Liparis tanakae]
MSETDRQEQVVLDEGGQIQLRDHFVHPAFQEDPDPEAGQVLQGAGSPPQREHGLVELPVLLESQTRSAEASLKKKKKKKKQKKASAGVGAAPWPRRPPRGRVNATPPRFFHAVVNLPVPRRREAGQEARSRLRHTGTSAPLVYLVTALVPSDTACFASSPGSSSLTAVCTSLLVMVERLLHLKVCSFICEEKMRGRKFTLGRLLRDSVKKKNHQLHYWWSLNASRRHTQRTTALDCWSLTLKCFWH